MDSPGELGKWWERKEKDRVGRLTNILLGPQRVISDGTEPFSKPVRIHYVCVAGVQTGRLRPCCSPSQGQDCVPSEGPRAPHLLHAGVAIYLEH